MIISISIRIILVISISIMIIYQALTQAIALLPSFGLWEWETSDSEISVLVEIHKYVPLQKKLPWKVLNYSFAHVIINSVLA